MINNILKITIILVLLAFVCFVGLSFYNYYQVVSGNALINQLETINKVFGGKQYVILC